MNEEHDNSLQGIVFEPSAEAVAQSNVQLFMDKIGVLSYNELVKRSKDDISWWWKSCEETLGIVWQRPYSKVYDAASPIELTSWFPGAQLNAVETVLDQKAKSRSEERAFIWEGEDKSKRVVTFSNLEREVSGFSNYLQSIHVGRGDVVACCLPMLPETIVAMLGTIKIGAVFSPIFCGYGPAAIASRLADSKPKLLITCDGYYRKGKKIILKPSVDEAIDIAKLDSHVLVVERLGIETKLQKDRDDLYKDSVAKGSSSPSPVATMSPDDPALLLYTSGTTGKPKGVVISHAGILLQPGKELYFNLDTKLNDVFMWITDIGWMMGPWQVFGAQTIGATHVIFEGMPDYPESGRIFRMIEEYGVTHLGHSATTVRMIRKYGDELIKEHDLTSLRMLGNTGEAIDADTWFWEMKSVGDWRCPMINLSGGTEIFGCFLLPSPVVKLKPSTLWGPGLGMDVDVYDDAGESQRGHVGYLVCKKPAPSMTRGFWNDYQRYIETYWKRFAGIWYHGDWAFIDPDGFWFLRGRADDVIKVAGRRIGPAEIESVLNSHPAIAESACVGLNDPVKGEKLYCFAIPRKDAISGEDTSNDAKKLIAKTLGKALEPEQIIFVEDLPRTRSGKIIRRAIRSVLLGENLGDLSTIENPESIEIVKKAQSMI